MVDVTTGLLGEHQPIPSMGQAPANYDPSPEEAKTIKQVMNYFETSKAWRKKYDTKWLDYYKMFRGKQWKQIRPKFLHSEVINMIFQMIQGEVPQMTDSKPKFEYLPTEPSDNEFAKLLSDLASADWDKHNWSNVIVENLYDSHIYGTTFGSMEFDGKANAGLGEIDFRSLDVFYEYPDPAAIDVNKESRYSITAKPTDIEIIKKKYPDKKDFVKSDLLDLAQGDKADLDQIIYRSPTDNKTIISGTPAYATTQRNLAVLLTCYWYPEEIEEEEQGDGDNKEYVQKLKYPNGRKTVLCNGVLLEDGPNPYEDGLIPKAKLVNYMLPREYYGMGDVEQLESPQMIFNKLVSFALDVLTLMGNPIWVVGQGAGIDTDNLFNQPGLVVEPADINQVRREEGVALQPYVLQLIDRMRTWFDGVSGSQEVTQGIRPEGITAYSAIDALQESARTRVRQKSRLVDGYLQDLGKLYKNRVLQFRDAPTVYRITNDQNAQRYFKMHVTHSTDEQGQPVMRPDGTPQRMAVMREFNQDESGKWVEDLEAKQLIINGDFDVKVTTGSSLPFAKNDRANLAFQLFKAGAIDEPELLKSVDYPNWEAVWNRVQQTKQAEAQAQQQAAQQQEVAKQQAKSPGAQPPPAQGAA